MSLWLVSDYLKHGGDEDADRWGGGGLVIFAEFSRCLYLSTGYNICLPEPLRGTSFKASEPISLVCSDYIIFPMKH